MTERPTAPFGLLALSTVFAASITAANIVASKLAYFNLPLVGGVAVPAGFAAIGLAFLCTDLLGELYGFRVARQTVNATLIALVSAYAVVYTAVLMPAAPFYANADAFQAVMSGSATIVLASILTMVVSQNIDVYVFHRLREYTDGRQKWLRNLGSTGVSQFADTAVFILLGFVVLPRILEGSVTPVSAVGGMVVGQWVAKVGVAVVDTPVFYAVSGGLAD